MNRIRTATEEDLPLFLLLAREVEPLFGPMVEDPQFLAAIREAIIAGTVFCAVADAGEGVLPGACIISRELNEIAWLAVAAPCRGKGLGHSLLAHALKELDPQRPARVTTFKGLSQESVAARRLYENFGFADVEPGEINPAGFETVVMEYGPAS